MELNFKMLYIGRQILYYEATWEAMGSTNGLNASPSCKRHGKDLTPGICEVTLLGNKVLRDVIKVRCGIRVRSSFTTTL